MCAVAATLCACCGWLQARTPVQVMHLEEGFEGRWVVKTLPSEFQYRLTTSHQTTVRLESRNVYRGEPVGEFTHSHWSGSEGGCSLWLPEPAHEPEPQRGREGASSSTTAVRWVKMLRHINLRNIVISYKIEISHQLSSCMSYSKHRSKRTTEYPSGWEGEHDLQNRLRDVLIEHAKSTRVEDAASSDRWILQAWSPKLYTFRQWETTYDFGAQIS